MTVVLQLVFARSAWPGPIDRAIRAWTGGEASHVGILDAGSQIVYDTTLTRGADRWAYAEWANGRVIVDTVPMIARSNQAAADTLDWLQTVAAARVPYDWQEALGFTLLREMGDPDRWVCSSLAAEAFHRYTGSRIADRRARLDPRHLRIASTAYLRGWQRAKASAHL